MTRRWSKGDSNPRSLSLDSREEEGPEADRGDLERRRLFFKGTSGSDHRRSLASRRIRGGYDIGRAITLALAEGTVNDLHFGPYSALILAETAAARAKS